MFVDGPLAKVMIVKSARRRCIFGVALFLHLLFGTETCLSDIQRKFEPASKAYLSPVVVSGHLLRKSPVISNKFTATFRIARIYKTPKRLIRKRMELVLQFWNFRRIPRTHHNCAVVAKSLDQGRKYFIFANPKTWDHRKNNTTMTATATRNVRIMTAVFEPVRANKKNSRHIKGVLCRRCARPPSIVHGLQSISVMKRSRIRLRCKAKGNPIPVITWYKDGARLIPSKRIRIRSRRKTSRLTVRHAKFSDAGQYECRAVNVVSKFPSIKKAMVNVTDSQMEVKTTTPSKSRTTLTTRPSNASTLYKFVGQPCPISTFCLNGGTCSLFESVGEFVCQCANGYKGLRCENKELSSYAKARDAIGVDATTRMLQLYWG